MSNSVENMDFEGKLVLVVGLGKSGIAAVRFLLGQDRKSVV